MNTPNHPLATAAMGVTSIGTVIGTVGHYAEVLTPIFQDAAYLVAFISGCISIYLFLKKNKSGK